MKKVTLLALAATAASLLLAPAHAAPDDKTKAINIQVMRAKDWRLDDVASLRDNGARGEVVLNGQWLRDTNGKTEPVLIPGGTDLKEGTQTYYRDFKLPKGWENRRLTLEIGNIKKPESLKVDGTAVSNFDGGRFAEYPVAVTPNKDGFHRIEVVAGGAISDDAWLRAYPKNATAIDETFIMTSVRDKMARVQMSGTATPGKRVKAVVTISETPDGPSVLKFSGETVANAQGKWSGTTGAKWENPKLWSRTYPNLYYYRVDLLDDRGKVADKVLPRRFGFREVWVDDGKIWINGVQSAGVNDSWAGKMAPGGNANYKSSKMLLEKFKSQGFNFLLAGSAPALVDAVDEVGMMASVNAGSMVRLNVWNPKSGLTDMSGKERREDIIRTVKKFREHPSVVMWHSSTGYSQASMHPELVGKKIETWEYFPLNRDSVNSLKAQLIFKETRDMINQIDPTRTVNAHNGPWTSVDMTTRYLTNDLDLQEREEFHSDWFNSIPLYKNAIAISEWGSPFIAEYLLRRVDFQLPQAEGTRPKIHLEQAARTLGDKAYDEEPASEIETWTKTDGYLFRRSPTLQKVASDAVEKTLRAWRTQGISASSHHVLNEDGYEDRKSVPAMKRFGFEQLDDPRVAGTAKANAPQWPQPETNKIWPIGETYYRAISPVYCYIGGGEGNFLNKDHLFYAGAPVRKALIPINERDDALELKGQWLLKDKTGNVVQSGPLNGTVAAGERPLTQFPIEFSAPDVSERTDFTLSLDIKGNRDGVYDDSFAITVFPRKTDKPMADFKGQVWMLNISDDRTHETPHFALNEQNQNFLRAAGLDAKLIKGLKTFTYTDISPGGAADIDKGRQDITEGTPKPGDLLIIPRRTLTQDADDYQLNLRLLREMNFDKLVEQGLRVVVFEQDLKNVFGLQTESVRPRNTFIAAHGHPVLEGLTDSDLSYWSGKSDLEPKTEALSPSDTRFPERMWHVSNTNSVATRTFVRPQVGSARALVVSGFDQQEAPLLEVTRGLGRILFCQMDVTNRYGIDPVATKIVDNLLRYAMTVPDADPSKSAVQTVKGDAVKRNLFHATRPQGPQGWGITSGDLFIREALYNDTWGRTPELDVPVFAGNQVVRRGANGLMQTTLSPDMMKTGWSKRKVMWLRGTLVVNQGGSLLDGPSLEHHGSPLDLYPERWVESFVHPYNANIW